MKNKENNGSLETVYIYTYTDNLNNNKGITLIALVITIIILLILAGITIVQLTGSGLFGKSKIAKQKTRYEAAKEIINLKLMEIQIDSGGKSDINKIAEGMREAENITIEKYYNTGTASIKHGVEENLTKLEGIVVSVDEYSEYKFLIGESCEIIGILEGKVTDKTVKEDFINVEEFEAKAFSNTDTTVTDNSETVDYIDNLLYKVNFNDVKDNVSVDESKLYATFDGQSGITINADTLDPDKKMIGTTNKTITLWYRTEESFVSPVENVLVTMGNCLREGGGNIIQFCYRQIRTATGGAACYVEFGPDNRFNSNWHFLAASYENGNKVRGYYDGTLEFIGEGNYYTDNAILDIGHLSNTRYYKGDMADIRVYSSALTKEQILQLYKYGKSLLNNK